MPESKEWKRPRLAIRLSIVVFLFGLTGCTDLGIFLVNGLASFEDYTAIENIRYGQEDLQSLNVYLPGDLPSDLTVKRSTVVFFYGGCWGGCRTRNKEDFLFVAQAMTSRGYLAVLVDYRRYPAVRFPEIIDDARRAVEWVNGNIERYGGDSRSIFLMGHSAGGHLGAMLTLDESYLHLDTYKGIRGFIGLAGPYDFLPHTEPYQKVVFGPEDTYANSQPINFVDGTEPPLLLLYGNDDRTVKPKNIINLAKKVRNLGGAVETHLYDGIDHGDILAALSIPLQNTTPVMEDIFKFLKRRERIE